MQIAERSMVRPPTVHSPTHPHPHTRPLSQPSGLLPTCDHPPTHPPGRSLIRPSTHQPAHHSLSVIHQTSSRPSVRPSIHPSVPASTRPSQFIHPSILPSVPPSVCLSIIHRPLHPSTHTFVLHPSIRPSMRLFVRPFSLLSPSRPPTLSLVPTCQSSASSGLLGPHRWKGGLSPQGVRRLEP